MRVSIINYKLYVCMPQFFIELCYLLQVAIAIEFEFVFIARRDT